MIINDDALFCSFIKISDKTYECSKCGVNLVVQDEIDHPPLIPCSAPLFDFSAVGVRDFISNHTDTNNLCDEEEIEDRHNICKSCEFFLNNSCTQCGCLLSRDKIYMNKLAIKSEACPLDKW